MISKMKQPVEKTIDDHNYRMRFFQPSKVLKHAQMLAKLFAPSTGAIVDGALKGKSNLTDVMNAEISDAGLNLESAANVLVERWDEAKVEALVDDLVAHTELEANGKYPELKSVYNVHFTGDPLGLIKFLIWGLEVQFGPFLEGLRGVSTGGASLFSSLKE